MATAPQSPMPTWAQGLTHPFRKAYWRKKATEMAIAAIPSFAIQFAPTTDSMSNGCDGWTGTGFGGLGGAGGTGRGPCGGGTIIGGAGMAAGGWMMKSGGAVPAPTR